jgi:hypothetical protein
MNYYLIKEQTKQLAKKYTFEKQFVEFIDQYTFNTQIQQENKIISTEFVKEIISLLDSNTFDILIEISDFNKYCVDGDIYNIWKIIYIKCYNPIIIIGTGVSGLTIGAGINDENILFLEARDRIGGRVYTNDKNMDMGAAWIHGLTNNPLNKFLNLDNLIQITSSNPWMHSENTYIKYLSNKHSITEEQRQELALKWNQIASKIGKLNNKTIIEGFKDEYDNKNLINQELFSFLYMIEVWCGGSIKDISTNFLNGYESEYKNLLFGDYGGSHCLFNNGAKTLLDGIIESADNITNIFDKIKFNQIVIKIINHDYYVQVYTSDGNIYNCNKLCIGIPPGPLKNIIFEPPLSSNKTNSLSKIKMGSYKKIQLEFEPNQVFWNEKIPMFLTSNPKITGKEYYLSQDDNSNKDNSNKDNKKLFPYILWNNYLYSKNKPILEAICPGDIGWKISGQTDEYIIDIVLSQLNNYFQNVPEPKA